MARSVSYLSYASHVAYISGHDMDPDGWDFFEQSIVAQLTELFPSLEVADRWDNNETHIILENDLAEVGISEYMGLISVSIRPKDDYESWYGGHDKRGLAEHWVESIKDKFLSIGDLTKVGTFSNGESVYKKSDGDHFSSKEGRMDWM